LHCQMNTKSLITRITEKEDKTIRKWLNIRVYKRG
jgi:hypothetical protein